MGTGAGDTIDPRMSSVRPCSRSTCSTNAATRAPSASIVARTGSGQPPAGGEAFAPVARRHRVRRNAHRGLAGRNVAGDHRVGADPGALAHRDRAQDLRAGADDDIRLQRRMPLDVHLRPRIDRRRDTAQRHTLVKCHVVADLGRLADHHPEAVVDDEAPADGRPGMDFDAGGEPPDLRDDARQQEQTPLPQRVAQPEQQQRMQARVAQHDLQARSGGGVASHEGIDVFAKMLENHVSFDIFSLNSAPGPAADTAPERSYSRDRI
jgi:hypothetical protein